MEHSASVYLLTGIPGTGKSTLLEESIKGLSGFQIVSFGSLMLEICMERKIVDNRDKMRTLSPALQKEIQEAVSRTIAAMNGKVIVDTHLSVKTPDGYLAGVPIWVLNILNPKVIIIVDSHEVEIYGRRISDTKRTGRDAESYDAIAEHLTINHAYGTSCSVLSGATLKLIPNHNGQLDKAAQELRSVLTRD